MKHYGPDNIYIFHEKNEHLRGPKPLFSFELFDKEGEHCGPSSKFMQSEQPVIIMTEESHKDELEGKEEWENNVE